MRNKLVQKLSEEKMSQVDAIIKTQGKSPGSLLVVLEKIQDLNQYLPIDLLRYVAEKMGISPSKVFGVATFYSYFSTAPRGRKVIKICSGTACYVKRSGEILSRLKQKFNIEEGEVTPDGEFSIEGVRCMGACGLAPVVVIGEETYGLIDPENVEEIMEKAGKGQ